MSLLTEEIHLVRVESCSADAPIVVALSTLGEEERGRLQKQFDISYFIAKEKLSFRKYAGICELEARHGVNIGRAYTTETSCRTFSHIAEAFQIKVVDQLKKFFFYFVGWFDG